MIATFLIVFVVFNILSTIIVLAACAVSGSISRKMEASNEGVQTLSRAQQKDAGLASDVYAGAQNPAVASLSS